MRCEEVNRLLPDYSVGNLPAGAELHVREHLKTCESCAQELKHIETIVGFVESIQPADPPPGLWNGVHNRITAPRTKSYRWGWIAAPRRALALGIGAAAALSIAFFAFPSRDAGGIPDPSSSEFIMGHMSAASHDAFADRVGLDFTAAIASAKDRDQN